MEPLTNTPAPQLLQPGTNDPQAQRSAAPPAGAPQPERDLWNGRMHWQHMFGRVLLWAAASVVIFVAAWKLPRSEWLTGSRIWWTAIILWGAATLLVVGTIAIRVWQTRYRLTTQRLFIERGILSRTMDQTELIRVDDVRMEQSFINRIFNIGTVSVLTTDVTDKAVAIVGIKDPIHVSEIIRQQMRTLRGKSVYIETL